MSTTTKGEVFLFTMDFSPLDDEAPDCGELFKNRCSSNMLADGLSAGFLRKQQRRKSFPSGDNVSGMEGVSLITLNIAAACLNKENVENWHGSYLKKTRPHN